MSWVAVGVQAANIVKDSIKLGMESATDCGKECRALCKPKTGWIGSGRTECKQKCKAECITRLSPEELEIQRQEERKEQANNLCSRWFYIFNRSWNIVILCV